MLSKINKKTALTAGLCAVGAIGLSILAGNYYIASVVHSEIENRVGEIAKSVKTYDIGYTYSQSGFLLLRSSGELIATNKQDPKKIFKVTLKTQGGFTGLKGVVSSDSEELKGFKELLGLESVNIEVGVNSAKAYFTTDKGKKSKLPVNGESAIVETSKLMGTVLYKYGEDFDSLALTLGSPQATLRVNGIPDVFNLRNFTHTIPLSNLLYDSPQQKRFAYTTVEMADYNKQLAVENLKFKHVKEKNATTETNSLSFGIGPNGAGGQVKLEGSNKLFKEGDTLSSFNGKYKLTLLGDAFSDGHNPIIESIVKSGVLKRLDKTTITADIVAKNQKIFFNGKDLAKTYGSQLSSFSPLPIPMMGTQAPNLKALKKGEFKSSPVITGK